MGGSLRNQAPTVGTYREAQELLTKQGLLGFFKGNCFRILHSVLQHTLRMNAGYPLVILDSKRLTEMPIFAKFSYFFTTNLLIDLIIHPLHLGETRFVLQNRMERLALYQSIPAFVRSFRGRWGRMWQGWEANVPLNLATAAAYSLIAEKRPYESMALSFICSNIVAYPLYTVMRRREVVSSQRGMVAGSLPPFRTHVSEIWQTEGYRGFYRGFIGYMVVQMISVAFGIQLQRVQMH